jgi:hypothetical protein
MNLNNLENSHTISEKTNFYQSLNNQFNSTAVCHRDGLTNRHNFNLIVLCK